MFSSLNTLSRVQIRAANQCWYNQFLFQRLSLWPHSSFDPPRLHPVSLLLLQRGPMPNPAGEQGPQASPLLPVRFKIQLIWRFGNIESFVHEKCHGKGRIRATLQTMAKDRDHEIVRASEARSVQIWHPKPYHSWTLNRILFPYYAIYVVPSTQ